MSTYTMGARVSLILVILFGFYYPLVYVYYQKHPELTVQDYFDIYPKQYWLTYFAVLEALVIIRIYARGKNLNNTNFSKELYFFGGGSIIVGFIFFMGFIITGEGIIRTFDTNHYYRTSDGEVHEPLHESNLFYWEESSMVPSVSYIKNTLGSCAVRLISTGPESLRIRYKLHTNKNSVAKFYTSIYEKNRSICRIITGYYGSYLTEHWQLASDTVNRIDNEPEVSNLLTLEIQTRRFLTKTLSNYGITYESIELNN